MEQTIKLAREFTIPTPRFGVPGTRPRYPFDKMNVSDYFVIPMERSSLVSMAATLRGRHKRHPSEGVFSLMVLEDKREIVIRIE